MRRRGAIALLLVGTVIAGGALVSLGDATFAAATGFSGRYGFTCVTCHTPAPDPLSDIVPDAQVAVAGLPASWDPGASYGLSVEVTGGPPALPPPAPQGGFEIETDTGRFAIPADMDGMLRQTHPEQVTYTPAGTLTRSWQVVWTAPAPPEMTDAPGEATFWVAVVAANGNHNAQLNVSDGGELGDASTSVVLAVPASGAAEDAWSDLPLAPPTAREPVVVVEAGHDAVIDGRHGDVHATTLRWRVDGGAWQERDTGAMWSIIIPGLTAGDHTVTLQSAGSGRVSPAVDIPVRVEGGLLPGFGDRGTPGVAVPLAIGVLITAALVRRRR